MAELYYKPDTCLMYCGFSLRLLIPSGHSPSVILRSHSAQSSSTRPGTRANSLVLFVTRIAPAAMACPAIAVSFGPMGAPAAASAAFTSVVASTAVRAGERLSKVLQAGKHCVVEKPFTHTVEEAETLYNLAKEKGVTVQCYQNRRFDSDFLTTVILFMY